MKKSHLLGAVCTGMLLIICNSVSAALLFNNGNTIDPTNPTFNDTYPDFTIYDDFQLLDDSTITDINYGIFINSDSNYTHTFVSILDAIGGTTIIAPFAVTGVLSSNGLVITSDSVPNGFDLTLSGLSIDLLAGSYAIGLGTQMSPGNLATIASGDSVFWFRNVS